MRLSDATICRWTTECVTFGPDETIDHTAAIGRLDLLIVIVAAVLISDCMWGVMSRVRT